MINFIHSGDIHLGLKFNKVSFGGVKGKLRREELWETFQRLVKFGIKNSKDFILLSGDVFEDNNFTSRDINRLRDLLGEAEDVRVVISGGNHDPIKADSLYNRIEWSDNVTIFGGNSVQKKVFDDIGLVIFGYSWSQGMSGSEVLREIKRVNGYKNILMLHGDVSPYGEYFPLDINQLRSLGMDYVALGHIHKPQFLDKNIAYCGSLEPLDFGELGDRGFIEGHLGDENSFKFVQFSKRRFYRHEVELNGNMTNSEIISLVKETAGRGVSNDFFRINLNGFVPVHFDIDLLKNELNKEFFHLELTNNTRYDYDLDVMAEENKDNIIGQYISSFNKAELEDPVKREALYFGLYALLQGGL